MCVKISSCYCTACCTSWCCRCRCRLYGCVQSIRQWPVVLFLPITADLLRPVESSGLFVHLYADDRQIHSFCISWMIPLSSKTRCLCISTKLHRWCGQIDFNLMLTSPGFCGTHQHVGDIRSLTSHSWCAQILWHQFICARSWHLRWLRPVDVNSLNLGLLLEVGRVSGDYPVPAGYCHMSCVFCSQVWPHDATSAWAALVMSFWTYYIPVSDAGLLLSPWYFTIVSRGRASPCDWFRSSETMRSTSTAALIVQLTLRSSIDDRSLPVSTARTWNSLLPFVWASQSPQNFPKRLKTELFQRSYMTASLPWLSIL